MNLAGRNKRWLGVFNSFKNSFAHAGSRLPGPLLVARIREYITQNNYNAIQRR